MTIKALLKDDFTTTDGTGETLVKKFVFNKRLLGISKLSKQGVIVSMSGLRTRKREGGRGNKTGLILTKLEALQANLEQNLGVSYLDPIEYIIQLYYGNNISINDIFNRFKKYGFDYEEESGFRKMLTNTLNWELRAEDERQKTQKTMAKDPIEAKKKAYEKSDEARIAFLNWMILNFNEQEYVVVDIDVYLKLPNKIEKLKYLLFKYYNVNLDSVKGTILGSRTLTDYLNPILEEILKKSNLPEIKIYMSEMDTYLKKIKK